MNWLKKLLEKLNSVFPEEKYSEAEEIQLRTAFGHPNLYFKMIRIITRMVIESIGKHAEDDAPATVVATSATSDSDIAQKAVTLIEGSEMYKNGIAAEVRRLISNLPPDLVKAIAIAVNENNAKFRIDVAADKKNLIRTAIPVAWMNLGWSEKPIGDSLISDTLVTRFFDARVAKDLTEVDDIVKKIVPLLEGEAKEYEQRIVATMGYKTIPVAQKDKITVAVRRGLLMGQTAEEAAKAAMNAGELTAKK